MSEPPGNRQEDLDWLYGREPDARPNAAGPRESDAGRPLVSTPTYAADPASCKGHHRPVVRPNSLSVPRSLRARPAPGRRLSPSRRRSGAGGVLRGGVVG